ncbi:division/cell wall cluster transcriptional repressor MraZ [Govanella unica]|uniref:Transcriptional regulator MraZ n=1 Tax=Govanella unica TaxID=2975056 RepID=A0A9X3U275_9PROT|nr:hypothetical protein [Govania unica]MDA5195069.1 division/cell wall cluster transcriptional repressor MraZ [Govania unica]
MPLFLSTFVNKVDRKGRVSVPATFRAALVGNGGAGEGNLWAGVVLYRSPLLPAIVGADLGYMERHSAAVDEMDFNNDPQQALAAAILADSRQLGFDPEGRILLPAELLAHANITEQVAFVGRGKTFQLWEPGALEAHNTKAMALVRETMTKGGAA